MYLRICFFCLIFSISSCSKKIIAEAPAESYQDDSANNERDISYLKIPIDIPISELENQINFEFQDLIYEDSSFTDNRGDDLKIKIWKLRRIQIKEAHNELLTFEIPLKIWAQKRVKLLGFSQTPQTTFEVNMKFASKIYFGADWKINTQTTSFGYEWISKPNISVGGIDIPLTSIIGNILSNYQTTIARLADEQISEQIEVKSLVLNAWNELKKPLKASDEYNIWVKIEPQDVLMTPVITENRIIKTSLAIKAYVGTLTGQPDHNITFSKELPPLKFVNELPNGFNVILENLVTFTEADKIANDLFRGHEFLFKGDKYKIIVDDISIYGTLNNKLVIKIKTTGSVNGIIYLTGVPVYDPVKKSIVLSKTDFDLKTKNLMLKMGSWILEGNLVKQIENEFGIPVDPILTGAKNAVENAMNSQPVKGVNLKGRIQEIEPDKVFLVKKGMIATVKATGLLNLSIKGL